MNFGKFKERLKGKKRVMEHHQTVARPHNGTPGCWATVWSVSTNFLISNSILACSRLSVSGHDRKSGRGTSGIWPGKNKLEKAREGCALSYFFYKIPLVQKPLFRSSPLTESLEQANSILKQQQIFKISYFHQFY